MTTGLRWAALFLLAFPAPLRAQWIADPDVDRKVLSGIDEIYNFDFERAEQTFSEVVARRPEHPAGYFFRAMIQWERILSDFDDESQDQRLYDQLDQVIALCDKRLEDDSRDVTALFFKGGVSGEDNRIW